MESASHSSSRTHGQTKHWRTSRPAPLTDAQDTHHPPADAHRIVDHILGSTYVELNGVGHSSTIEAPADVTAAIRHLLETAPSP